MMADQVDGRSTGMLGWILVLLLSPLIFIVLKVFVKVTWPLVVAKPAMLILMGAFCLPVLFGFIIGRSVRDEYRRRRYQSNEQSRNLSAMRAELEALRRERQHHG